VYSPFLSLFIGLLRVREAGCAVSVGDRRGAYRVLMGRPEGKRRFGRLWYRWDDDIKMDLQEVGWGGLDLVDLA
jgi:hypothetical protein